MNAALKSVPPISQIVTNAQPVQGPHFEVITGKRTMPDGVYYFDDSDKPPTWVCSPLRIEAETRSLDGNGWGRLLVFHDGDGREHRWAMPCAMLSGDGAELRSELLSQGLTLSTTGQGRRLLIDYIQREKVATKARCVTKTGWHGDAFVLPDRTLGKGNGEPVIFQTTAPGLAGLSSAGTLDGWREYVAKPCAGNSRLVLALSVAFSAPCLDIVSATGGGVHFRGPSSVGKTTCLLIASSVYGNPGFMRTWRQTDNALEGVAALHNDMLLTLDELGQLDPRHAGQVAYMLANGQGKGRSNRSGGAREVPTWNTAFLSSGERSIGDLVDEAGGKRQAGHDVRVLDVAADAGEGLGIFNQVPLGETSAHLSDQIKAAAAEHYGTPLIALLERVTEDRASARQFLKDEMTAFMLAVSIQSASGQVQRVANRFAVISAAGELATSYGITGWAKGEARQSALACFKAWIDERGGDADAERAALLSQVRAFFEKHGDSRFEPEGHDNDAHPIHNRVGFKRKVMPQAPGEGWRVEYLVMPEAFKDLVRGFNPKEAAKMLNDEGWLLEGSNGKTSRVVRLQGEGKAMRAYVFDDSVIFGHSDDDTDAPTT